MQYYFIIKIYFCQITVWFICFLLNFVRIEHAERSSREKFSGNSNGRYAFTGNCREGGPIAKKRVVSIAESGRLFYKRFAFYRIKAHRKKNNTHTFVYAAKGRAMGADGWGVRAGVAANHLP